MNEIQLGITAFGGLTLTACLCFAWRAWRTTRAQLTGYRSRLAELEQEFNALLTCSKGLGDRVHRQRQELAGLSRRQDEIELIDEQGAAVAQALKLIDAGVPVEQITRVCELSAAEVQLVGNIARYKKKAA
ncbi:MAG: DUF2802 domain-containing protein [Gammaproteobacteria bacterium]|nr:DUF2802 domain-containing protein [Gammaproteobacteria bacterium]